MSNLENALQIGGYLSGIPKQKYLDMERRAINGEAIADITDRTTGASGFFYDLFDNTNDHSAGIMDTTKTTATSPLTAGDTNIITKVDTTNALIRWFLIGQEITIQQKNDDGVTETKEYVTVTNGGVTTESTTIDYSTPITAVSSAYTTSASARPQYLSNGNIVIVENNAGTIQLQMWETTTSVFRDLCSISGATAGCKPSIASKDNIVYVVFNTATVAYSVKIDTITVTNTDQNANKVTVDTVTSFSEGLTLCIDSAGTYLHFGDSSKVSAYSLSFNIRYCLGTISAVDGSVTWGSVVQVTTLANGGTNSGITSLCLVVKSNGNITIVGAFTDGASTAYQILSTTYTASWQSLVLVYNGLTYAQSSPDIIVDQNGILWVTWYGKDATDAAVWNIHCKYSNDGGVTWVNSNGSTDKLTSGNTRNQQNPSITYNKNNSIFIMWDGTHPTEGWNRAQMITYNGSTWGAIEYVNTLSDAYNVYYPSTCNNFTDFTIPLAVWRADDVWQVKFRGIFTQTTQTPHLEITPLQNSYKTNVLCYRSLGNVDTVNGRLGFSEGFDTGGGVYVQLLSEDIRYTITPPSSVSQIVSWDTYSISSDYSISNKFSLVATGADESYGIPTLKTTIIEADVTAEDQNIYISSPNSRITKRLTIGRANTSVTNKYVTKILGALG